MAAKTLMLKGLTNNAGIGTDGVLDITEKVLGVNPSLSTPTITSRYFSTIVSTVHEGVAKYLIDRKAHITQLPSTASIHTGTTSAAEDGHSGPTTGALTTSGFKQHRRDAFTFTLDKAWETNYEYDKKKDPLVREGELISDLASLQEDLTEGKAYNFYNTINEDTKSGNKSAKFSQYPSSANGAAIDAPDIKTAVAAADKDKAEVWVDKIFNTIEDIALIGRKGSAHQFYPYARGTRGQLGLEILIKSDMVTLISKDSRYVAAELSPEIIRTGVIGYINNVPVVRDEMFDTSAITSKVLIMPKGKYSPVIVAEELPTAFMLFDHPTKPTRADLLEGSGGYDTAVTPYINLCRLIEQATA